MVLHVILISEALTVERVMHRVAYGGYSVLEDKIKSRRQRLWAHVAQAAVIADETTVYANSSATTPFKIVTTYRSGKPVRPPTWPHWAPAELAEL